MDRFSHLPLPLFLDFDGVLHHFFPRDGASSEENALFAFLPDFEEAVRESPRRVQIIISSTWRHTRSLPKLRSFFSPDIASLITDATPVLGSGNGPGGRQCEIEAWLESKGRLGQEWIAIDDMPSLFRPGATVVVCDDGFTQREASLLQEALKSPKAYAVNHPVKDLSATGPAELWVPGG